MASKDWRKKVTVVPPDGIRFQQDPNEAKPYAMLTIKNILELPIMFKVKTTVPGNYLVRPNQGMIRANSEAEVKIFFNFALDSPVSAKLILVRRKGNQIRQISSFIIALPTRFDQN